MTAAHQELDAGEVRARLRRMKTATFTELAAEIGVSRQYLSDVLAGRREAGPAILHSLGLERVVVYREKGAKKS